MATNHDIVAKLWNMCHVQRDDCIIFANSKKDPLKCYVLTGLKKRSGL